MFVCLSVCLSICLSICPIAYLENTCPIFIEFSVRVIRVSIYYALPVFLDDVMFPNNGWNRPESKNDAYVSFRSPGGSSRGKVCRLRLHIIIGPPTRRVRGPD